MGLLVDPWVIDTCLIDLLLPYPQLPDPLIMSQDNSNG